LRLADGTLFPIPINLDVSSSDVENIGIKPGARVALRDPRDDAPLAIITGKGSISLYAMSESFTVEDIYAPNKAVEAEKVFGDDDPAHPAVFYLHNTVKDLYIGGKVQAIQPPTHFDYVPLRCKYYLPFINEVHWPDPFT